ncbi:hypothetical protein ACTIVE_8943 [Actinomadura verrucosospora]|uniref:Uncharacterized protein n=1 Tax=Actinomadura verrucosospora TaxID=46165 RepID=A0A7D4AWA9_ACTVE|nr:hypothetical protein ACTIVE_8943 [Actinomadura verrucosospora]
MTAEEIAAVMVEARGGNPREMDNPDVVLGASVQEGVWVPSSVGQPVRLRMDAPDRGSGVQVPRSSMRVYPGVAAGVDVVAFTTADGAALLAVLRDPSTTVRFRCSLTLPDGLAAEPTPSGGLDVLHPRYGATAGRLYKPWANDSMFRPLPAEYIGDSTALTVQLDAANASYPIVVGMVYSAAPR